MDIVALHQLFLEHPIISTDTRNITENCMFFALKGANFNGNEYASEAIEKGASYAIVDEEKFQNTPRQILVDDVLATLQKLATYHRNKRNAKVISLTGSNGKTTTKELINSVLKQKYRTIATQGNLNNHIGVPLTLLSIQENTEIAIVEMGANHQKEIAFLSSMVQPDFGYITNFGKAHLEGFGGVEGVIKGKSELYDYLIPNKKSVFLNADDSIQLKKLESYIHKYGFSTNKEQYYKIEFLEANPFVHIKVDKLHIRTQLIGSYNFTNCAAAILMGKYFNVPLLDIKKAIESYCPDNNRSQIISVDGHHIILDAYNANPTSMEAAIENLSSIEAEKKTVILGDMFELGESAAEEHQRIARKVERLQFDTIFLVGENFAKTETRLKTFNNFRSLSEFLQKNPLKQNSTILIKGSRGMALERILDLL